MKAIHIACTDLGGIDRALLDLTKQSAQTVLVPPDAPALRVAQQIDATSASLAMVIDARGEVTGVLAPGWIRAQLNAHKGIRSESLFDALSQMQSDPQERQRDFEHEWLNYQRPKLHWCPAGMHFTDPPVCPKHGV